MNDIIIIIQARIGSQRLLSKVLLDLAGKPLLSHVIERAQQIEKIDKIVVATSCDPANVAIYDIATALNCEVIFGSDDNLLERFILVSRIFNSKYIIRITADNPFIDFERSSKMVELQLKYDYDLFSLTGLPIGTGIEIFKTEVLEAIYKKVTRQHHKEHVTTYIRDNPFEFNTAYYYASVDGILNTIRLTVDNEKDFILARNIYDNLYKGQPFLLDEVIEYLKDKPDLAFSNQAVVS